MSKRICIWGDSIAHGFFDTEVGGWVNRLSAYCQKEEEYSVYNLGVSGNVSSEVLNRFDTEAKARNPMYVVFAVGVNDALYLSKENKPRVSEEDFEKNLLELISQAKKYTKDIYLVLANPVEESKVTPIPWDPEKSKTYLNKNIEKYNEIIKSIADKEGLVYIDIYNKFVEYGNYYELLHDGLHPNNEGHQLIFETVKDKIL